MNTIGRLQPRALARRLSEAEQTISALLSGEIDAVLDAKSRSPLLLREAQQALLHSEARYRQIVDSTSDGIMRVDPRQRIVFASTRCASMLGYTPDEMRGMALTSIVEEHSQHADTASIVERPSDGTGQADRVYRRKDGTTMHVNVAASALFDTVGLPVGSILFIRDTTEKKRLQERLIISDRMASVGVLAAGVAHEINNPLAALMASLDFIEAGLQPHNDAITPAAPSRPDVSALAELKSSLSDARSAAERMQFIVRELSDFSRSPELETHASVNVQSVMEASLRMASMALRHRARIITKYGEIPHISGHAARLGQVFLNLLLNAAHAMPEEHAEDNELQIATTLENDRVVIDVADNGVGIGQADLERIFDPFYTTKPVGVGTGLGLAICRRIVTDMGGELTVSSELGRGATFRVSLPPSVQSVAPPVEPLATQRVSLRRARILLVDDEALVLRATARFLGRHHDVVPVSSAAQALALCARGEAFDLILCDLMMPDMTGMELEQELLRVAPLQAARIVFVTGGAVTTKTRDFLAAAPNGFLDKPYDTAKLNAVIQRHLSPQM